jgi:hypothetical protein
MQEIKVGSAVRLMGGGPISTVIAADEPPPEPPFPVVHLSPAPAWKPGSWRVAWYVQGALRIAVLPGEALMVVKPPPDTDQF